MFLILPEKSEPKIFYLLNNSSRDFKKDSMNITILVRMELMSTSLPPNDSNLPFQL
jgi:hypothetical protein